jgi:hypothetical protein
MSRYGLIRIDGLQGKMKRLEAEFSTILRLPLSRTSFLVATYIRHHISSHLLTISVTLMSLPLLLLLSLLLCLTQANFGPESLTLSMSGGPEEP